MANTYISLNGGLDLESPPIGARPGACTGAFNFYESVKGGYTTMLGYERYDGLPAPSGASYYYVLIENYDSIGTPIALTDTLVLDGLTLTVCGVETNGSDEAVIIGCEPAGTAPATPYAYDGASVTEITALGANSTTWETGSYNSYLTAAQDVRRALISVVPGDGPVRGVAQIEDTKLAWRDDGSDLKAYTSSASGWVEVPNASVYEVDVTGDTVASVGDVCNSGDDIVLGVYDYLTAGSPDANKRVYVVKSTGAVPTSFINDVGAVDHGSVLGTVSWTPAAGGKLNYVNHNFYAGLLTYNTYFADGVNCAMVYNTEHGIIQPIASDYRVIDDVVKHVYPHNARLFMSTAGGTYITSTAGEPTTIDGFLGSQEVGLGDDITGFAATDSENLAIFTRNRTFVMEGTTSDTWKQRPASKNSGARDGCIAATDDVFASDDRGIARLSQTEKLGGFEAATATDDVQRLFNAVHADATCATTMRKLNQMRFYYGNRFLVLSRIPFNANGNEGIRYGITEGGYDTEVVCVSTEEDSTGDEQTFFGSDDGYVYHMDSGQSADGADMEFILSLHYNHLNSPLVRKRFVGVDVEAVVVAPTTMQMFYYMNDGKKSFDPRTIAFVGGTDVFDVGLFDQAVFDSVPLTRPRMSLRGTGYNLQLSFYRQSSHEPQATLTGYALRYKERGLVAI